MDDKLAKPEQQLGLEQAAQFITYPRPAQLFSLTECNLREAIIGAVTRLAAATKATVEAGVFLVYADNLEDLPAMVLSLIFTEAERSCKFLPTPAELREMAAPHMQRYWEQQAQKRSQNKLEQWRKEWDAEAADRAKWLEEEAHKKALAMKMDELDASARRKELQQQKVELSKKEAK